MVKTDHFFEPVPKALESNQYLNMRASVMSFNQVVPNIANLKLAGSIASNLKNLVVPLHLFKNRVVPWNHLCRWVKYIPFGRKT